MKTDETAPPAGPARSSQADNDGGAEGIPTTEIHPDGTAQSPDTTSGVPNLTDEQQHAVARVMDWFHTPEAHQPLFRLFGPAGTGKTTLARVIARHVEEAWGEVGYAAFTGKAAHVLRRKGCTDARTIHSLIYVPVHVKGDDGRTRVEWQLNEDSEIRDLDLLIIDECSMVGPQMADDLLSFRTPLLVLGDPAQLPPVGGEGALTNHQPDILLQQVHRQALESPVLALATDVRHHGAGAAQQHKHRTWPASWLTAADQVLVGRNRTRWLINDMIRTALGRPAAQQVPGDRVIVLTNNRGLGVFNGQQFDVLDVLRAGRNATTLLVADEDGAQRELPVLNAGFHSEAVEALARRNRAGYDDAAFATWANAITVHKSQGSQWGNVLVVDESFIFRGRNGEPDHSGRWLYTAITRAERGVGIVAA